MPDNEDFDVEDEGNFLHDDETQFLEDQIADDADPAHQHPEEMVDADPAHAALFPNTANTNSSSRPEKAIPVHQRTTSIYMTKYERARLLGTRALQLSMNAPPMVDLRGEVDPFQIARRELEERKIPLIIRRLLPDGSYEDW